MKLSPHEIAWLVIPRWDAQKHRRIAVAVFLAESDGETDALARSSDPGSENLGQRDHGLTQISGRWAGDKLQANPDWRDPEVAVDLAKEVWLERKAAGRDPWSAWSVYNGPDGTPGEGRYKTFLPDADFGLAAPFPPPRRPATNDQVVELLAALNAKVENLSTRVETIAGELAGVRKHFT